MRSLEKKIYLGLLVCLLVSIVGTSFAYFVTSTSVGGEGGKVDAKTADMVGLKFNTGDAAISLENAVPGVGKEKTFAVELTPTNNTHTITYAIMLNITGNTFEKCTDSNYREVATDTDSVNVCLKNAEELVYTLIDADTSEQVATGDLTGKNGNIQLAKVTKNNINDVTTVNYKLNVTFKNTNADQNHNMNKTFAGTLGTEFAQAD